jgi:beta-phosphoglucomutase-like phosphatase (HAD superfamily)
MLPRPDGLSAGAVIKVDDTEPGIAEGVEAGCVTVGLTLSGNEAGLTPDELAALSPAERAALHERVAAKLIAAGADYVIGTVAELPATDRHAGALIRPDRHILSWISSCYPDA